MRASPGEGQQQTAVINAIHKQPVRLYMAFPIADVIAGKRMIAILCGQLLAIGELTHYIVQKGGTGKQTN